MTSPSRADPESPDLFEPFETQQSYDSLFREGLSGIPGAVDDSCSPAVSEPSDQASCAAEASSTVTAPVDSDVETETELDYIPETPPHLWPKPDSSPEKKSLTPNVVLCSACAKAYKNTPERAEIFERFGEWVCDPCTHTPPCNVCEGFSGQLGLTDERGRFVCIQDCPPEHRPVRYNGMFSWDNQGIME